MSKPKGTPAKKAPPAGTLKTSVNLPAELREDIDLALVLGEGARNVTEFLEQAAREKIERMRPAIEKLRKLRAEARAAQK